MARKAKSPALYVVKVWPVGEKRLPLVANFTSEKEAADYEWALRKRSDVEHVEMSPGYLVYKTAEEALESYMMWAR